jgi:hypothetical protein
MCSIQRVQLMRYSGRSPVCLLHHDGNGVSQGYGLRRQNGRHGSLRCSASWISDGVTRDPGNPERAPLAVVVVIIAEAWAGSGPGCPAPRRSLLIVDVCQPASGRARYFVTSHESAGILPSSVSTLGLMHVILATEYTVRSPCFLPAIFRATRFSTSACATLPSIGGLLHA